MKKFMFMGAMLLALSSASCGGSLNQAQPSGRTIPANMREVQYGQFSYFVPQDFKTIESKNGKTYQADPNNTITVIMESEKFNESLGVYVWARANELKSANDGTEILGAKLIKVNHKPMVILISKNDKVYIIQLLTVNKKQAYTLSCGGANVFAKETIPVCKDILVSLKTI